MKIRNQRFPARVVTPAERAAYAQMLDSRNPGYLDENLKLISIVKILTGVRVVYGLFYLAMTVLYGMGMTQGVLTLFSAFVFYVWYSVMLRSGKIVAVLMMVFRGGSIVYSGVSTLQMSFWLPFPLIFTLVAAAVMEFCEAVFCIYVLFNSRAAHTIRLNREMDATLARGVAPGTLGHMAEYQNPYGEDSETDGEEDEPDVQKTAQKRAEEEAACGCENDGDSV